MSRIFGLFAIIGVFLISILLIIPVYSAGQCAFGSAYAWFKSSNDTWMNATVHPLLRRGEPFEIQVVVTSSINLSMVFIKLHEFGTPVYDVIEGPTAMEQLLECPHLTIAGQSSRYRWTMKVRDDTSWVNGYAPLEVFVQFNKNDTAVLSIHFAVITAYIIDEAWANVSKERSDIDTSLTQEPRLLPTANIVGVILISMFFIIVLKFEKQKR